MVDLGPLTPTLTGDKLRDRELVDNLLELLGPMVKAWLAEHGTLPHVVHMGMGLWEYLRDDAGYGVVLELRPWPGCELPVVITSEQWEFGLGDEVINRKGKRVWSQNSLPPGYVNKG